MLVPRGSGLPGFDPDIPQTLSKNGVFVLPRVPPGSYNIQAAYMDRETMEWISVVRQLEVTDADVEGITLAFAPSFGVRGRVISEGVRQGDLSSFTAVLTPADENSPGPLPQGVKPDGSFLFRNVNEGEYRPGIRSTNGDCYLKSARARGRHGWQTANFLFIPPPIVLWSS
jgi:hypothetical protein